MRHRYLLSLLAFILATLLAGCGSDPGFDENTDFVVGEGVVQFVNMMPDSPNITMIHGLQNSQARFPFIEAVERRFEDRYDWRAAFANNSNDEVTVIEGKNQVVTEDVLSTFLLMGTIDNPRVEIVDTPFMPTEDRPEGRADVWFAANVTYIDMVDIYLTDDETALSTAAPLTTVTSGTFTGLISVAAGETKRLRVTLAGTQEVLFDSGTITIPEQSQELFALVDDFGPDGTSHVNVARSLATSRTVIRDQSQPSSARIANFTSVSELTAEYAGSTISAIPSASRSAYFSTGFGEFPYRSTTQDGTVLEETDFPITSGSFATIYNFDNLSDDAQTPVRSLIAIDQRRPVTRRGLFKFINGSSTVVDFYILREGQSPNNSRPFISNAPFGSSVTTDLLTAPLRFIVRSAGSGEEITRVETRLEEKLTYTMIFTEQQELLLLED